MQDSLTERELATERAAAARGPREGLVPSRTDGGHHPDRDTKESEAQRPRLKYAKHCEMVLGIDPSAEKNSDTKGPGTTPAPHSENDTDTGRNLGGGASDQRRAPHHHPAIMLSRAGGNRHKPILTLTIRESCKGATDTTGSQRSTNESTPRLPDWKRTATATLGLREHQRRNALVRTQLKAREQAAVDGPPHLMIPPLHLQLASVGHDYSQLAHANGPAKMPSKIHQCGENRSAEMSNLLRPASLGLDDYPQLSPHSTPAKLPSEIRWLGGKLSSKKANDTHSQQRRVMAKSKNDDGLHTAAYEPHTAQLPSSQPKSARPKTTGVAHTSPLDPRYKFPIWYVQKVAKREAREKLARQEQRLRRLKGTSDMRLNRASDGRATGSAWTMVGQPRSVEEMGGATTISPTRSVTAMADDPAMQNGADHGVARNTTTTPGPNSTHNRTASRKGGSSPGKMQRSARTKMNEMRELSAAELQARARAFFLPARSKTTLRKLEGYHKVKATRAEYRAGCLRTDRPNLLRANRARATRGARSRTSMSHARRQPRRQEMTPIYSAGLRSKFLSQGQIAWKQAQRVRQLYNLECMRRERRLN